MDAYGYFDKYGEEGCTALAKAAGTNWPYFKQIVYGFRRASPDMARKLVLAAARLKGEKLDLGTLLYPGQGVRLRVLAMPKPPKESARRTA